MLQTRTRFAPSPTGPLHIGGARTALYNCLFARQNMGLFILRFEDTDEERSKPEFYKEIVNSLDWLGLKYDLLTTQKSNQEYHHGVGMLLLRNGAAYEDDGAVRLKVKDGSELVLDDVVQGTVKVNSDKLDDPVILRSDGTATYLLANAVDDHTDQVSHVIRGDDHLTNTFRQMAIFKGLDWRLPTYAHIPLIHSIDGKKLSKRDCPKSVLDYKEEGILPGAMINFLARLGWGHASKEIFTFEELVKEWSLGKVSKGAPKFDPSKFKFYNREHRKLAA